MAQATASQQVSRRSPLESFVDKIWRFFCSVRIAVAEIALLALLVLIGTLRGSAVPRWIADGIPFLTPLVDRWYAWDVYHSLIFTLLLAVIAIAIAVCTINRIPGIWKSISDPTVRTSYAYLNSGDTGAVANLTSDVTASAAALSEGFQDQRYRFLQEQYGDEIHLYADRNRFGKLGTFPFHLALIMMMLGGIVGAQFGFRENAFIVPEGSVREVGYGTGLSVRLDQFTDSWREEGTPAEYRSDLTVIKNGEEVKSGSITVNHPMTQGSVTFYQASYGQTVSMRVTDSGGQVLYDDSAPLGLYNSRENPDAPAARIELPQTGAFINVIAPDNKRTNAPQLDQLQLESGQMYVQLEYTGPNKPAPVSAVVDQGVPLQVGNLTVEFLREGRYTVLQVASNPGMPIFWAASFMLVAGLAFTFYFPHRRIRAIVAPGQDGEGSLAMMAPMARRDWSGKRDFIRTVQRLETEMGITAQLRTAASGGSGLTHQADETAAIGPEINESGEQEPVG